MYPIFAGVRKLLRGASSDRVIGYTEEHGNFALTGWIVKQPDSKLYLEHDGRELLLVPRFYERDDLLAHGIDGHGFNVELPLPRGFSHFRIKAEFPDKSVHLRNAFTGVEMHTHFSSSEPQTPAVTTLILDDHDRLVNNVITQSQDNPELLTKLRTITAMLSGEEFKPDILFVDGMSGAISAKYRVQNVVRGLEREGLSVAIFDGRNVESLLSKKINPKIVVFFRCPYWTYYAQFCERMRAVGASIIYDIDDYVFDTRIVPAIDGVRALTEDQIGQYLKGIDAYREFMLRADAVTVSTHYLADAVRALGQKSYRVRNTISKRDLANLSSSSKPRYSKEFVIGYYSGTFTHEADFSIVADALAEFMRRKPIVSLRLVGSFDFWEFDQFNDLYHRISRVDLMPHEAMLADQGHCQVIISPLELDNPFCEGKSELKFFEAAAIGIPVICSATSTLKLATKNGTYAHLCRTKNDWAESLEDVYENYERAIRRAGVARSYVCENYVEDFAAREALAAYRETAERRETRASVSALLQSSYESPAHAPNYKIADVGFIVPDILTASGGHRKILTICRSLVEFGYSVALYVISARHPNEIRRDIRKAYFELNVAIFQFRGAVLPHKALVCTSWETAYRARNIRYDGARYYFVQDYEPLFHQAGSDFIRAVSTYRLGYQLICYGDWVAGRLKSELGVESKLVRFTLDHKTYSPPLTSQDRCIDVLIFGRQGQERRCFDLVLEAARMLKERNPDLKIGIYGDAEYSDLRADCTVYGELSDPNELASLYRNTKVGICFSTTNPSMVGYEMIACGTCLIDVRSPGYELNFGSESFVKYCDGSPESIVDACLSLLSDDRDRQRRQALGYQYAKAMRGDDALGEQLVSIIFGSEAPSVTDAKPRRRRRARNADGRATATFSQQ